MIRDPWYRTTLTLNALSGRLRLNVPHDVFSTQRIDEGTLLLLDHLPAAEPKTVLDMGCGYGALGLPIAARFPAAGVELVDRDLLAVKWSRENAAENKLLNVNAHGSLGFRDLGPESPRYDWILCNIPARIGRPFMEHLLATGQRLLKPEGELRVVVIADLAPLMEELDLKEEAQGPRHRIYSFRGKTALGDSDDLYLRDQVEIGGLSLDRPFDLGGDDPKRLTKGLPVLIDVLPRQPVKRVFCFRCGYGPVPLISRKRWPDAQVVAVDRDLLATSFTRRNAEKLGLAGSLLEIREEAHFPDALLPQECYPLILGELSPSAGERVTATELEAISRGLSPGGQALLLCLDKLEREWVRPAAVKLGLTLHPMIAREGHTVLRLVGDYTSHTAIFRGWRPSNDGKSASGART